MNKMTTTTGLRGELIPTFGTRFETLDSSIGTGRSLHAQLGGKLRKIFTLPSQDSTPEPVARVLRELAEKVE